MLRYYTRQFRWGGWGIARGGKVEVLLYTNTQSHIIYIYIYIYIYRYVSTLFGIRKLEMVGRTD